MGAMMLRRMCAEALARALPGPTLGELLPHVTVNTTLGSQFAIPAVKLAGDATRNGVEAAKLAAKRLQASSGQPGLFEDVRAEGGRVLLDLPRRTFANAVVSHILAQGRAVGSSDLGSGRHVCVEFSSPNIAKPFHAGHLRSTVIGAVLARIHEKLGFRVTKINYLGDWGKQFGLLGVGFKMFGSDELLRTQAVYHLFDVYVKTNAAADADPALHEQSREFVKRLEDGCEAERSIWARFREASIVNYQEMYRRLGVSFDVFESESQYSTKASAAVESLKNKNLLRREENGAYVIDMDDVKLGSTVLTKANGSTMYLSRDYAAACDRAPRYTYDRFLYVTGAQQELHFKQLFHIFGLTEGAELASRCTHVGFGLVKGMSTRRGTVVFLQDLLDEAAARMMAIMEAHPDKLALIEDPTRVSEALGLSAIIVQDLSAKRLKDYAFDWNAILKSEGNTGPFLQYTHARLWSIEKRANEEFGVCDKGPVIVDLLLHDPEAYPLICILSHYETALEKALEQLEPSVLVQYLFRLARAASSANSTLRVKGAAPELARQRLLLFQATRHVLASGLEILGLSPLERI